MEDQKKEQNNKHIFANDSEACPEFNWTTDSGSVLMDIKYLMKGYYVATFTNDGAGLKLRFNNGQSFIISVVECS